MYSCQVTGGRRKGASCLTGEAAPEHGQLMPAQLYWVNDGGDDGGAMNCRLHAEQVTAETSSGKRELVPEPPQVPLCCPNLGPSFRPSSHRRGSTSFPLLLMNRQVFCHCHRTSKLGFIARAALSSPLVSAAQQYPKIQIPRAFATMASAKSFYDFKTLDSASCLPSPTPADSSFHADHTSIHRV